jgi:hypothetical protein
MHIRVERLEWAEWIINMVLAGDPGRKDQHISGAADICRAALFRK